MHIPPEKAAPIIMIGCFDTKAEVFAVLYEELRSLGRKVITINTGILGSTDLFPVSFENLEVMSLAGNDLSAIAAKRNRNDAVELMARGAGILLRDLTSGNAGIGGIVGMGGGGGSYIVLKAMEEVSSGSRKYAFLPWRPKM